MLACLPFVYPQSKLLCLEFTNILEEKYRILLTISENYILGRTWLTINNALINKPYKFFFAM